MLENMLENILHAREHAIGHAREHVTVYATEHTTEWVPLQKLSKTTS